MFPDLGLYLVEQGQKEPFELAVFNHLMLGIDAEIERDEAVRERMATHTRIK